MPLPLALYLLLVGCFLSSLTAYALGLEHGIRRNPPAAPAAPPADPPLPVVERFRRPASALVRSCFELGVWSASGRVLLPENLARHESHRAVELSAQSVVAARVMASAYSRGIEQLHRALVRTLPDVPSELLADAVALALVELPRVEADAVAFPIPEALAEVSRRPAARGAPN